MVAVWSEKRRGRGVVLVEMWSEREMEKKKRMEKKKKRDRDQA